MLLGTNLKYLPYRVELLEALRDGQRRGLRLVLASDADPATAERIAEQLGLFETVHLVENGGNGSSSHLGDSLTAAYGEKGFDCLCEFDLSLDVVHAAHRVLLLHATARAIATARHADNVMVLSKLVSLPRALVKQLRPHQWAKNALVILPVLLAPDLPTGPVLARALLAVVTFSLCASAGYVFNDLLDLEADRAHATKYLRPLASGALPVVMGPPLFLVLLTMSFGLAWAFLPQGFSIMLGLYFVGTLTYSLYLKRLSMLDVLVLAGLYTHRILSGGIAAGVKVSTWLLGFSMFLFTSLAFAKRYVELRPLSSETRVRNRGYSGSDVTMVGSMGTASGFISALVFTLYVDSAAVRVNYREPALLWLVLPILLYWLGRIWLLTGRGQMRDDPVKFALRDRLSLGCGLLIAVVATVARYSPDWLTRNLH